MIAKSKTKQIPDFSRHIFSIKNIQNKQNFFKRNVVVTAILSQVGKIITEKIRIHKTTPTTFPEFVISLDFTTIVGEFPDL